MYIEDIKNAKKITEVSDENRDTIPPSLHNSPLCGLNVTPIGKYELEGKAIGKVVDIKNNQYGDSINDTAEFLKCLFPNGIKPENYKDLGILVRIYDKMKRIANGNQGEENAYKDIAGYAILMSVK